MSRRVRYWRREGDPLTDDLVCPKCGENAPDRTGEPKLRCACEHGKCFAYYEGVLTWRRSCCPNAICDACGWKGTLRSRHFQQKYQNSRCAHTVDGWHNVNVYTQKNEIAGPLVSVWKCKACGAIGHVSVPYSAVVWEPAPEPEQKSSG